MVVAAVASLALSAGSAYMQARAKQQQKQTGLAVANYNAKLDEVQANQLAFDTEENIRGTRRDAATYISRQAAGYAAAGVLNTGSPLAVMASTAGRAEQSMQQRYTEAAAKEEQIRQAGKMGQFYAEAQGAELDTETWAIGINGAANMSRQAMGLYQSGAFG